MGDFQKTAWKWREAQPLPGELQHDRFPAVKLAVPFLVAGLFYLWGKALIASVVAVIGVLFVLLRLAAPQALESVLALLAAAGRWLGKAVSYASLTVAYALIFTPAAVVSRLLRRDPLDLAQRTPAESYWVAAPQVDRLRLFDKPFLVETRDGDTARGSVKVWRVARALYHTALTLLVLNLALGSLYLAGAKMLDRGKGDLDPRAQLDSYDGGHWATDYFREFAEANVRIYRPFIGWVRKDYEGRYINVKDSHRKTLRTAIDSQPPLRLYTFGASAMWGTGARDDFTIASYLVKLAARDGIALDVQNYGEAAFVNWQNVIRLAELCAEGKVPDVVVFYEGAADAGAKLQTPDMKRVHQNFSDWQSWVEGHDSLGRWFEAHSLVHILGRKLGSDRERRKARMTLLSNEPERVQRLADEVVTTYAENAAFVRKLGEVYGFKAYFFWQPVVYTKKTLSETERKFQRSVFGPLMAQVYQAATEKIRTQDLGIIDLADSFDSQERSIFIDWAHVVEPGNELVAEKMYEYLRPTLEADARTKKGMAQASAASLR